MCVLNLALFGQMVQKLENFTIFLVKITVYKLNRRAVRIEFTKSPRIYNKSQCKHGSNFMLGFTVS